MKWYLSNNVGRRFRHLVDEGAPAAWCGFEPRAGWQATPAADKWAMCPKCDELSQRFTARLLGTALKAEHPSTPSTFEPPDDWGHPPTVGDDEIPF